MVNNNVVVEDNEMFDTKLLWTDVMEMFDTKLLWTDVMEYINFGVQLIEIQLER